MKDLLHFTDGEDGWLDEAQALAAAYDGKKQAELIRAVYARAAEGRWNGTLTDAQIDDFCARLSPMLDGGKRKKLYELAAALKKM